MHTYQRPSTAGVGGRLGLRRQATRSSNESRKLFLVAVDGSELSMRGVRLAAYLMNPGIDRMRAVMVAMPRPPPAATVEESLLQQGNQAESPTTVLMAAKSEAIKCGIPANQIEVEEVTMEEEPQGTRDEILLAVAQVLVSSANRSLRRSAGMLVLGAAGIGKAQHGTAKKAVDLGPVAQYVLQKAKCAVTFCKEAQVDLDSARRTTRFAMHIAVCADGSHTSRGAFDTALRFCKAGDKLTVIHIENEPKDGDRSIPHKTAMIQKITETFS